MALSCLFGHKWDGCKCEKCGKTRDEQHSYKKIPNTYEEKCEICGHQRKIYCFYHSWKGCKCENCGKTRNEQHSWQNGKCTVCGVGQSSIGQVTTSKNGLKNVTIYMGHHAAGQLITREMNSGEIDAMLGKLADQALAQRIRIYAKNHKIAQQMLNIQVPNIASQEEFAAFVNRAFPETSRPPYADIGVVLTSIICYFIVAEKE